MKKIYFSGSVGGGRGDAGIYKVIIDFLKAEFEILTEEVGDVTITVEDEIKVDASKLYIETIEKLKRCDFVVVEASMPSLGVGYEIAMARVFGKPVICLYRLQERKTLSAVFRGDDNISVNYYSTQDELTVVLGDLIKKMKE